MKKPLAFLLALLMALSLAACGAGEKETDGDAATPPATDGSEEIGKNEADSDPPATDGSVSAGHDGDSDIVPDQSEDSDGNDGGMTEDGATKVTFLSGYVNVDVLGYEHGSDRPLVVETKEELQPYLETLQDFFASSLKMFGNIPDRVSCQALEAAWRVKYALETFEKTTFLYGKKLLFIRCRSNNVTVSEAWLAEKDGKLNLQIDANVTVEDSFGTDAEVYCTCWIAVSDDLNIDYENDVVFNVTYLE